MKRLLFAFLFAFALLLSWAKAHAQAGCDQGPCFHSRFVGAVDRSVNLKLEESASVTDFGAKCDGVTDDTAAIAKALTAVCGSGNGGTVVFPRTVGLCMVNPRGSTLTTPALPVYSNCTIRGEGRNTGIRVVNNAGNYLSIFGTAALTISNVIFDNFRIDQNAANQQSAPTDIRALNLCTDGSLSSCEQVPILLSFAQSGYTVTGTVLITRMVFDTNTGVWAVGAQNGTNQKLSVQVSDSYFNFQKGRTTDGTTAGGVTFYDTSTLLLEADSILVRNNTFSSCTAAGNCTQASTGMGFTAMEVHGGQITVAGNNISNYATGVLVSNGGQVDSQPTQYTINNNNIVCALQGIILWPYATRTMRNLTVTGNAINLCNVTRAVSGGMFEPGGASYSGISTQTGTTGGLTNVGSISPGGTDGALVNFNLSQNVITFEEQDRHFLSTQGQFSGGILLFQRGSASHGVIQGNNIRFSPSTGIRLGAGASFQKSLTLTQTADATARLVRTSLAVPVNSAFTTGVGTLPTRAAPGYCYRITALNAAGETTASTETCSGAVTGPIGINVNWGTATGATRYNVYGNTTGAETYQVSIPSGTTTWLDNGSIAPSGAAMPAANTTSLVTVTCPTTVGATVATTSCTTVGLGAAEVCGHQMSLDTEVNLAPGEANFPAGNKRIVAITGNVTVCGTIPTTNGTGTSSFSYAEGGANATSGGTVIQTFLPLTGSDILVSTNEIVDSGSNPNLGSNTYRAALQVFGVISAVRLLYNEIIDTALGASPNGVLPVDMNQLAGSIGNRIGGNKQTIYGTGGLTDTVTTTGLTDTGDKMDEFVSGTLTLPNTQSPDPTRYTHFVYNTSTTGTLTINAPAWVLQGVKLRFLIKSAAATTTTVTLAGAWKGTIPNVAAATTTVADFWCDGTNYILQQLTTGVPN